LDLVVSNVDKYKGIPAVGSRALADALLYSKKEECEADILALISMRMTLSPKQLSLMAAANKVAGCGDILCAINLFKKVLFFFHFISVVFCILIYFGIASQLTRLRRLHQGML
jgi:hypothetical protein